MKNFWKQFLELFFPPSPILKPDVKEVEISGQKIYIRSLSAGYAMSLRGNNLEDKQIFEVLSESVCDKNGKLLLKPAQVEQFGLTSVNQLVKEVMSFNSMSASAVSGVKENLKKTEDSTDLTSSSPAS